MGGAPMNPGRFLANASVYQPSPVHRDPFINP
jgi:hypothetical protein